MLFPETFPPIIELSVTVNVLLTVPPAIVKPIGCDVGVSTFTLVALATPKNRGD